MKDQPNVHPDHSPRPDAEWCRAILANTRDVVTLLDRDLSILYESPSVEEVLGYRPEELIGRHAMEFVHPDDRIAVQEALETALRAPDSKTVLEVRFRHKDTGWRMLEVMGRNLIDEPAVGGILVNSRDITERRQVEASHRESERLLATLLRDLPVMVYRCQLDRDWTMSFVSEGALDLTGYSPAELTSGKPPFAELIHPEDRERVWREILAASPPRDVFAVEYRLVTRSGDEKWVRDVGRPVFTDSGDLLMLEGVATDVTAQRLREAQARDHARVEAANEQAQAAARRTETILDSVTDGFMAVDGDWRVTYVNRRAAEMGRRSPAELIGRHLLKEFSDTPALAVEKLRHAMDDRVPVQYEVCYEPLGLWLQVHAQPASGGLAIYVHDISERKRGEEALRESEERFRQLADNIGEVFWMFTPDFSRTLYVNPAYERVFGAPADALYRNPTDFVSRVHPADRERVRSAMDRVASEEITVEMRVLHPDGAVHWVAAHGLPIRDSAGRSVRVAGVTRDITERKTVELELRRQHLILESIIEGTPDVVFVKGRDGRYRVINSAAAHLMGRPRAELQGASDEEIFPADLAQEIHACDRAVIDSGQVRSQEQQIPTAAGDRTFHVLKAPLRDEHGAVDGVIGVARDMTDRKLLEHELRERAEHYHLLFHDAPTPMWLFDAVSLRFIEVNDAAVRRYGYSREEFQTLSVLDIRPPEDRGAFLAARDRMLREDAPDYEAGRWKHLTKHGQTMVVEVFVHRFVTGGRTLWMVTVIDVTEQVQAEMRLRESEERFRQLAENIRAAFWIFDADFTRTLYVSPAYESIWGRSRDELLRNPRCCPDSAVEDDREKLETAMARVREEPQSVQFRILRPDGEERWLEWQGFPIRDDAGDVYRIAGLTEDITARKRAELALQRQSEMVRLLQLAAVAANESACLEDALRTVMSQACKHLRFAVGHVQLLSASGDQETPTVDLWCLRDEAHFGTFRAATEGLGISETSSILGQVRQTKMPAWVPDLAEASWYPRGEVARRAGLHAGIALPVLAGDEVVAVMEFFSHERLDPDSLLLEAMGNVGAQLGRVVERRRAEEALRRAKEEAERANRAKSEFLSRMSHELRTPMNAILGFAQVLEMDLEREDDQESVQQILRAGRHLLRLIDEVLDLARIEAERITLSLEPVHVADVVGESLDLVRPAARERGVAILPLDLDAFVRADQQRLKQVLLNLVTNGIKYNREGGKVTISCESVAEDRMRIRVADTGRGLTAEQRERMFVPFERLGAEQTAVQGTGLGLSLSKGLVEAMGGSLGVESVPSEGSTFWIELPRAEVPGRAEREALLEPSASTPPHRSRRVLYIEDNLSNLRLVERILTRRPDLTLIPATQGRLGLELAREHRPELILLDVHLPDITGSEVMEELRRDPALRDIPVIVLSADATPGQIERMRKAGAREYLTKPIEVARLLEALDAALAVEGAAE